MLFKATEYFKKITGITIGFLRKNNIKGLILDVDNTLTTHDNPCLLTALLIGLSL